MNVGHMHVDSSLCLTFFPLVFTPVHLSFDSLLFYFNSTHSHSTFIFVYHSPIPFFPAVASHGLLRRHMSQLPHPSVVDVLELTCLYLGFRDSLDVTSTLPCPYQSFISQSGSTDASVRGPSCVGVELVHGMIIVEGSEGLLVFLVRICGLLFIFKFHHFTFLFASLVHALHFTFHILCFTGSSILIWLFNGLLLTCAFSSFPERDHC